MQVATVSIRSTNADKQFWLTVVLSATVNGKMLPTVIIFKGKRALNNMSVLRKEG